MSCSVVYSFLLNIAKLIQTKTSQYNGINMFSFSEQSKARGCSKNPAITNHPLSKFVYKTKN